MQAKITEQYTNTPSLDYVIQGTRKISPSPSSDNIVLAIKLWMLLRFIGNHTPQIHNNFPKKWTIEDIIYSLATQLYSFNLRPHIPFSTYMCERNVFILDGTCKISFKVCAVLGCMRTPTSNSNTCNNHKNYKKQGETYTGKLI